MQYLVGWTRNDINHDSYGDINSMPSLQARLRDDESASDIYSMPGLQERFRDDSDSEDDDSDDSDCKYKCNIRAKCRSIWLRDGDVEDDRDGGGEDEHDAIPITICLREDMNSDSEVSYEISNKLSVETVNDNSNNKY